MSYRCRKGCKNRSRDGDWHDRKSDCPYEPEYRQPTPAQPTVGAGAPEPATATSPPPSAPSAPTPRKIGLSELVLSDKGGPSATVQSRNPLTPAKETVTQDWILDPAYSRRAWVLAYGGVEYGVNAWGRYWENPKPIDHAIFEFSNAQNVNFESPDSYMCRLPTWFLKQMGCTTLQEAQSLVDDAEFIRFVAAPLVGSAEYMWTSYQDSPKLKKARDEAEARAARLKASIPTTGTPVPMGAAT